MPAMRKLAVVVAAITFCGCSPSLTALPSPSRASGLDLTARIAARATGGVPALVERVPQAATTTTLVDLAPHAVPGGPDLLIADQSNVIGKGRTLVILGDAVAAAGTTWLPVYALDDGNGNDWTDFFTWIPTFWQRHPTVDAARTPECPAPLDNLSTLAALDPFTRARCVGATAFTIEGTTARWWGGPYEVTPSWLGSRDAGSATVSLRPKTRGSLPIRIPTGLVAPPPDITVRATVHVADPEAATCRRSDSSGNMPPESAVDSELWCSVQIVLEQWTPVLGLDGLPFDPASPQIRQRDTSGGACAGVGMAPATFRIDPTQLDPVWLERDGTVVPTAVWFGLEFRFVLGPDPVIVDDTGQVVVRDGLAFDPNQALAGHFMCPTGQTLVIY